MYLQLHSFIVADSSPGIVGKPAALVGLREGWKWCKGLPCLTAFYETSVKR